MKDDKKIKSLLKSKDRMLYAYNYDKTLTEEEKDIIEDILLFDAKLNNMSSALSTGIPAFFLVLGFVLIFILKL